MSASMPAHSPIANHPDITTLGRPFTRLLHLAEYTAPQAAAAAGFAAVLAGPVDVHIAAAFLTQETAVAADRSCGEDRRLMAGARLEGALMMLGALRAAVSP